MRLDFGAFLGMLLLPSALAWGSSSSSNPKRILLSDVESLTFTSGRQTSHRRVSPIPQLRCISPSKICSLYEIDTMRCVNSGSGYDSEEIQWTCTASLPSTLELGSTNVICEGYDYPEDKYVLKGSCGVEYRMLLTDDGERQHPDLAISGWTWGGILFGIVFIGVLGWIIYSACVAANGRSRGPDPRPHRVNRNNRWDGGGGGPGGWGPGWGPGGGGGGFGGNDPPPPYPGNKRNDQEQQGWRPGFWSGVAGGAAAGYVAGRQNDSRWGWGGDQDYYDGGGHRYYGSIPPRSRSNNGSNTTMHTSTGFGTTSRR